MAPTRKAIMFIMDGLGDRPIKQLGGRTPLESAATPWLDSLASRGICGLMDPLAPGIRVGTDVGHLALFGYNPLRVYWGRGPIEAAGVGVKLEPRDVALRCNFATVDENGIIVDRRAGRIRRDTGVLAEALNELQLEDDVEMVFREATEHRAVLVLKGEELSAEITNSDPGAGCEGEPVQTVRARRPGVAMAERTADIVNRFVRLSHEVLKDHPDVYYAGFVHDAQKEHAEARQTYALIRGEPLPSPEHLGVGYAAYLNGLGEAVGELRRHGLDQMRHRDVAWSEGILETMDDIYYALVSFDYPTAISGGLKRTADVTRSLIERTRGDVTNAVRQQQLEKALADLWSRLEGKSH